MRTGKKEHASTYLAIARFGLLPADVYYIFSTKLSDISSAMKENKKAIGIQGTSKLVEYWEICPDSAAMLEDEIKRILPSFPFGETQFTNAPLEQIRKAVADVFSRDPRQTAFSFRTLEEAIKRLKASNDDLATKQRILEANNRSLARKNTTLHNANSELIRKLEQANARYIKEAKKCENMCAIINQLRAEQKGTSQEIERPKPLIRRNLWDNL